MDEAIQSGEIQYWQRGDYLANAVCVKYPMHYADIIQYCTNSGKYKKTWSERTEYATNFKFETRHKNVEPGTVWEYSDGTKNPVVKVIRYYYESFDISEQTMYIKMTKETRNGEKKTHLYRVSDVDYNTEWAGFFKHNVLAEQRMMEARIEESQSRLQKMGTDDFRLLALINKMESGKIEDGEMQELIDMMDMLRLYGDSDMLQKIANIGS